MVLKLDINEKKREMDQDKKKNILPCSGNDASFIVNLEKPLSFIGE